MEVMYLVKKGYVKSILEAHELDSDDFLNALEHAEMSAKIEAHQIKQAQEGN